MCSFLHLLKLVRFSFEHSSTLFQSGDIIKVVLKKI